MAGLLLSLVTMAVITSTNPYWSDSGSLPQFPRLSRNGQFEVVIIGGGITGLTAAYLLKRAGRRVAVLDRGRCALGDTGHTSAHLTCVTDTRLTDMVSTFGRDHARAAWDAGLAAIEQIAECVDELRIDCAFGRVPGYLHVRPSSESRDEDIKMLRDEAALADDLGFDARYVDQVPYFAVPGIEFAGQGRIHPRQYLAALARAIDGDGSEIFEHSPVDDVSDDPLCVCVGEYRLTCDHVVVATHNPIVGKASLVGATLLQTKLSLYSTYVVGGRVPSGTVPDALFWDTGDPYRYIRVEPHQGFDYVIFGGEDHKTGQVAETDECFERLEHAARATFPGIDITHRWSGQVIETNDGLPLIGEMAPRQFAATGFSGNGLTFGTVSGMMAADAIIGRTNPWAELFDMGRTKIKGGLWDYLKENKDYPYYFVRDHLRGAEAKSLRAIPRGSGKIVDLNGKRVAASRDDVGVVTVLSPVCTHMGCQVQWNTGERTWDCPCHGSRFKTSGAVISGPAETPLERLPRGK
jgi:glycine/D-amino acid oxidase-like deaminating enzyme/nitrite reductase/ring-hydroxylating ferredoxin subunit